MRKKHPILMLAMVLCLCIGLSATAFAGILVREGSRGPAVEQVQTLLEQQGYATGGADGICGKATVKAIQAFQRDHGLTVDGVCGDATYRALSGGEDYQPPEPQHHGHVMYFSATAYSAEDPGLSSHTATGALVRKGVAAVDPSVIPLGTHLFVPGYGEAVAADIGYGIRGNSIDLAFDTHAEAIAFGRQDVEVYIVE